MPHGPRGTFEILDLTPGGVRLETNVTDTPMAIDEPGPPSLPHPGNKGEALRMGLWETAGKKQPAVRPGEPLVIPSLLLPLKLLTTRG